MSTKEKYIFLNSSHPTNRKKPNSKLKLCLNHGSGEGENMYYMHNIMEEIWNGNYDYSWIWVQKQQVFIMKYNKYMTANKITIVTKFFISSS